jgi:hypothetical protein
MTSASASYPTGALAFSLGTRGKSRPFPRAPQDRVWLWLGAGSAEAAELKADGFDPQIELSTPSNVRS